MAITVNWPTRTIFVPKADTTLVQASPEVRSYDVELFWTELRALADDGEEGGQVWPIPYERVAAQTLSGNTYSPIVKIINNYQVEFEDGQYTVSLQGPNNNILDVKVANQVSVLANNSAGSTVPLTPQTIRDAMALALSSGVLPDPGSVDDGLEKTSLLVPFSST